ncbi:MAG TPA: polymer-forming cytoskeletal protein [Caldithrix sp.]|nr:polymer-forming cytoskeletal protein [Caldithrix sp.]
MALKLKEMGNSGKASNELNFLGEGTYVEGLVETKGSLRIDGKVKGTVKAEDILTVGSNGVIEGEVNARSVILGGRIEGNIKVEDKLVLETKSTLIGNLKTKNLVIDEGAVFQGKSDMGASTLAGKTTIPPFKEKSQDQNKPGEPPKKF